MLSYKNLFVIETILEFDKLDSDQLTTKNLWYNTLNAKNAMLMELKKVIGSIYDRTNNMSINNTEYNVVPASTLAFQTPGKFYVPFQLEKLHSGSLLTGISTNNSNISVNIDQTTAVDANNKQCNLILT